MLDYVMPEVSGCSTELAVNALRLSCIEFYQKSWIKKALIDATTVVGQSAYTITPPTGFEVCGVSAVFVDGRRLAKISNESLTFRTNNWRTDNGAISGFQVSETMQVVLLPTPETVQTIQVEVALRPSSTSTAIDTAVYTQWAEAITSGAKARLMAMPSRPYSSPEHSVAYRAQFHAAISEAKWAAIKGGTNANLTVSAHHGRY